MAEERKKYKCNTCERVFYDVVLMRRCMGQHLRLLNKLTNILHQRLCPMSSHKGHDNNNCGFYDFPRNRLARRMWIEKAMKFAAFTRQYGIPPEKMVELVENI